MALRSKAITGGGAGAHKGGTGLPKLPPGTIKASPDDYAFLEVCCCSASTSFLACNRLNVFLCRELWPSCCCSRSWTQPFNANWLQKCLSELC